MRAAATAGYTTATSVADTLVELGVPFREAHHIVGALVARAEAAGVELTDLADADVRDALGASADPRAQDLATADGIADRLRDAATLESALARPDVIGGTAPHAWRRSCGPRRSAWAGPGGSAVAPRGPATSVASVGVRAARLAGPVDAGPRLAQGTRVVTMAACRRPAVEPSDRWRGQRPAVLGRRRTAVPAIAGLAPTSRSLPDGGEHGLHGAPGSASGSGSVHELVQPTAERPARTARSGP